MILFIVMGALVVWGLMDFFMALLHFVMAAVYLVFGFIPNLIRWICH